LSAEFPWKRAVAVFLLAFAVRAAFLAQWAHLPYIDSFCTDAWAYNRWALDILHGRLIRHTAFYQSPFYPYFLAAFYKLAGYHPQAVLWVQAFADSCACVVLMRVAQRCFGARAALPAGLLCAFYRPLIFNTGLLTKETFVVLALSLFVLSVLRCDARAKARDYFLCGALAGWCALLRANVLLLVPAALLWLWLRRQQHPPEKRARGGKWRAAIALAAGLAIAILPAAAHNFIASRDVVLINYTGGFTFFTGNNPEATGTVTYPSGIDSDPLLEERQSTLFAQKAEGRTLKPSEVSSFWFRKGTAFIINNPYKWLGLTCLKFWYFWNWYEIPDNYNLPFITKHFDTVLNWPLASFALIGSLGAVGLFFCRLNGVSGLLPVLLAAYLASILPFWISGRYRLPGVVFLLPLAAGALMRLADAAKRLEPGAILKPCLAAVPLILLCLSRPPVNVKFSEAAGWGQLTGIYCDRGEYRKAVEAFLRASALEPESLSPSDISKAAVSLHRLGQSEKALELYRQGNVIYPQSALLYNNQGSLLFQLGRTREAVEMLKKAVETDPDPGLEYRNLFHAYSKLGKRDQAIKYGELAAARFPEDEQLQRDVRAIIKAR